MTALTKDVELLLKLSPQHVYYRLLERCEDVNLFTCVRIVYRHLVGLVTIRLGLVLLWVAYC